MILRVFTACLFLSLFIVSPGYSQKAPIKFGKIDEADLHMTHYEKDSSASAVILCDYGVSRTEYNKDQGFYILFEKTTRIKILTKDGLDWANGEIYLYHEGDAREKVSGLRGYTYNYEDGKVVKTKMANESIYSEKADKNRDIKKFTLPDVKVGSVIEYNYKISSDFTFNFQDWVFQHKIPVKWSEYRTYVHNFFEYQTMAQGYLPFKVASTEMFDRNLTITTKSRTGGITYSDGGVSTNFSKQEFPYKEVYKHWVIENVPAFKKEPYITTARDYVAMVRYELAFTNFPSAGRKNVMGTWDKLNSKFLSYSTFGQAVKASPFLKKELQNLGLDGKSNEEKIASVFYHVQNKMSWNGDYAKYLETNLRNPYEAGEGSSAEINLVLTSMLQKAGLQADPVLLSTRSHGRVRKDVPISEQFNYVICKVQTGDKYFLLDATERYLPIGMLPERCLNGSGRVISEINSGWVSLAPSQSQKKMFGGKLNIDEDGIVSGTVQLRFAGYAARPKRKKALQDGEESYIENRIENTDWEINELRLENTKQATKPFIEKYDVESIAGAESMGNMIYLNALVFGKWEKNPFTVEQRVYPVDLSAPIDEMYFVSYEMPDGYSVESVPEKTSFALPNNAGTFSFQANVSGRQISVISKLKIGETVFVPDQYPTLKAFFAMVIAKQQEQIVLKKT